MRKPKLIVLAILLIGFTGLGLKNVTTNHNKLRFQDIQLKSTKTDLLNLQLKYDLLNQDLQKEVESKDHNSDKIKQLEDEKKKLEDEQKRLQAELQAKADKKTADEQKVAQTAVNVPGTAKAYAAPVGDAKSFIYSHESGNNPGAINRSSGACGLGQALPCSKMPCSLVDYACQDIFFTNYMIARYGSWENARAFWMSHNWW